MSPEEFAHREWLGYVQPVGLVVSVPALLSAQCYINKNIGREQQRLIDLLPKEKDGTLKPEIVDFPLFVREVLSWDQNDLILFSEKYTDLEVVLPQYRETLQPTFFIPKDPKSQIDVADGKKSIASVLVKVIPPGRDFDETLEADSHHHWQASPQSKFERLLRETNVPVGILTNGTQIRLIYSPRGESSGYMTFSVSEMASVAGRPIFSAMHALLCVDRLFLVAIPQRLPAILSESRKYQNTVSTQLAEQVMSALFELLRGLQAANDQSRGELLREVLADDPNEVYKGLLTVLMRLVFVLYAEDRGLLSDDPVYVNHYSVTGLFDRLRSDAGRYPDTMEQRYGAWAQLLTLFRMVFFGARHNSFTIPARSGYLFDPKRYPFLEGRIGQEHLLPRVPDGVIFRVLSDLLILDGERLSYRALDVEQIGSVYETIMGFNIEVSKGRSIAIKPVKSHGAPSTINLEPLLEAKPADRIKLLKDVSDQSLTGQSLEKLKSAKSIDDLLDAVDRKIAKNVTPNIVPAGAMIFQPSDERRRSGSHYTPRALTEPIVRTTLRPVLEQLGDNPIPADLLKLKICDPAMGSGAFLVEACRQVADQVVAAWSSHQSRPYIPLDEDEILHARRLVAQRCLYGVDKNPMAVDLAKLSLWLATLAKDHPFTFLDHALRCGDSLVGLTRQQIIGFDLKPKKQLSLFETEFRKKVERATAERRSILEAGDDMLPGMKEHKLKIADEALSIIRLAGDAVAASFFSASKPKERQAKRDQLAENLEAWVRNEDFSARKIVSNAVNELRSGQHAIEPFHWEAEFSEVFTFDGKGNATGGFDCIVGNPPFAGKNTLLNGNREGYLDWLQELHEDSHGNSDLVAHFFRSSFNRLRNDGCFGLIATNTIGQGDTRSTGLRWICNHGGQIYQAQRRFKWPGQAAVVVSVVNVIRGEYSRPRILDGKPVEKTTAFLFHRGGNDNPATLKANADKSFIGSYVLGMGFTFDDTDTKGIASSIAEMNRLIESNSKNAERIFPYIGGEELLNGPLQLPNRYVINFAEMNQDEASSWPELLQIVEERVKPERMALKDNSSSRPRKEKWWLWGRYTPGLFQGMNGLKRVLMLSRVGQHAAMCFKETNLIPSEGIVVIAVDSYSQFGILQSRIHETWTRFFASSMKDDLRYTPSDCFETFPFPKSNPEAELTTSGELYYTYRAALMVENNEGLTKTYNRFHDPGERASEIAKLRILHADMDRAVLEAYGWHDLAATANCEFLLDYEEEEEGQETSRRKKPWRYRWPDDFRDEVLARLLELNALRAQEEVIAGAALDMSKTKKPSTSKRKSRKQTNAGSTPTLPGM